MTRSVAIAAAIADELTARRAVLDAECGPETITLIIEMDRATGEPHEVVFQTRWRRKPRRLTKAS